MSTFSNSLFSFFLQAEENVLDSGTDTNQETLVNSLESDLESNIENKPDNTTINSPSAQSMSQEEIDQWDKFAFSLLKIPLVICYVLILRVLLSEALLLLAELLI